MEMMEMNEDKRAAFLPFEKKLQKSIDVIKAAEKRFGRERIALAWGGGKDSTVILWMVKSRYNGDIPFRVFAIESPAIRKEVYDFRERMAKEWRLDLLSLTLEDPMEGAESFKDPRECCRLLKTAVLRESAREYGVQAVLTGIRWDEHPACAEEIYFSEQGEPVRVNPLLHFMEKDIWHYIKADAIPYCELYDRGYRHLGSCSSLWGNTGHEHTLETKSDKEKIMETLRDLGYL
jgi:phosphoadenosine phosphosulfate reductase